MRFGGGGRGVEDGKVQYLASWYIYRRWKNEPSIHYWLMRLILLCSYPCMALYGHHKVTS